MPLRLGPDAYLGEVQERRVVAGLALTTTLHRLPARLPLHTHETPYFCLAMNGAFLETAGARVRDARPGTLLFHPAGEAHTDQIRSEGTLLLNIALGRPWLRRIEDLEPLARPDPGCQSAAAARVAQRVAREMSARDGSAPLAIEGLVLTLLAVAAPSRSSLHGARPAWLPVALDFIRAHFATGFTYETLARIAGVHPTHLARAFHRHTGRTVTDYVHRLRIEWACQRLAQEGTPLVQVALDAGYADHAHFTRTFRRATGMTPSEYRRRHRGSRSRPSWPGDPRR